jgi:hydroxyacylglutathione hydrolase
MELLALPALVDNYIWMLHNGVEALVVDPGEATPVERALDASSLKLVGILVTHHHGDHVGGIKALLPRLQGPVVGTAHETIPGRTQAVREGDRLQLLDLEWQVLDVPGHTAGHVAYFCDSVATPAANAFDASPSTDPLLFCGDTLFSAGCGRIFDGTPEQFTASLQRLAALPGSTRVCCTHEYTLSNLRFAQAVEPSNPDVAQATTASSALREQHRPTLPSTLSRELRINPFLRGLRPDASGELLAAARQHGAPSTNPAAVFTALRQWKNEFR